MNATTFDGQIVVIVSASWLFASSWVPPAHGRNIHIGAACARAFAQYGAQVIVVDPDAQALADLESEGLGGTEHAARMLQSDCCDLTALTNAAVRTSTRSKLRSRQHCSRTRFRKATVI